MATEAVARSGDGLKAPVVLPGRRYDHYFFSGMALLMRVTVFVGFAPSYYLAGLFRAPLPSPIIHVHGALFSCWILLLVTQTSLVSAGRVDLHRRLGIAGFMLACVMGVVGVWAATDGLVRQAGPPGRGCDVFLHHPAARHADFCDPHFLRLPRPFQSVSAQAPDPGGHSRIDDRRPRSLANRTDPQKSACRGAGLLPLSGYADGL